MFFSESQAYSVDCSKDGVDCSKDNVGCSKDDVGCCSKVGDSDDDDDDDGDGDGDGDKGKEKRGGRREERRGEESGRSMEPCKYQG